MNKLLRSLAPAILLNLIVVADSRADLLGLTGFVDRDFASTDPTVHILKDRVDDVAQPSWMTARGWTTGFNIQDLRLRYDSGSDTLQVGINFVGIAGDADGNGNPGAADPLLLQAHGKDTPHLSGSKSIVVAFGTQTEFGGLGSTVLIAGVPEMKSLASDTGLDGFTVASYLDRGRGLGNNFGAGISGVSGSLAFDPSADHPGFEFSISNASKVAGLDFNRGFYLRAQAGDPGDAVIGEDAIYWTKIGPFVPAVRPLAVDPPPAIPAIPESSSIALLMMGLGSMALAWFAQRLVINRIPAVREA